ncbi:MAG TPA: DUF2807 domain-containing protein [Polyangiaceae bacterium]|nr:DUF2807 domain-containing protein [Polyangiaceae bacterium]
MLRSRALCVVCACLVVATACKKKKAGDEPDLPTVSGSGVTSSESRKLPPFTRLTVNGALELTVSVGQDAPLELHGDSNLFSHVKSNVVGGDLTLEPDAVLKPAQAFHLAVGTAKLEELRAAVAAKVTVHGVKSDAFSVQTGGGAQVVADGSSSKLGAAARMASRIDLSAFSASSARVAVLEFGRVELGYVEKLDATQRDVGTIVYRGTPDLTTHADRPQNVVLRR